MYKKSQVSLQRVIRLFCEQVTVSVLSLYVASGAYMLSFLKASHNLSPHNKTPEREFYYFLRPRAQSPICTIVRMIAKKAAAQNPPTLRLSERRSTRRIMSTVMTKVTRPSVRIRAGSVMSLRSAQIVALTIARRSATMIGADSPGPRSTLMPRDLETYTAIQIARAEMRRLMTKDIGKQMKK